MAVAAGLCVLGLENKVQAILLIGALPLLMLPFGSPKSASVAFWRNTRSKLVRGGFAAVAAIASSSAAWPLISVGFDRALLDAAHFHPLLLGRFGLYQPALLALIAACMIAYAAIWRVSAAETLASMFCGCRRRINCAAGARCPIQRQQRDRRAQSAGKNADLCRRQHHRCRKRVQSIRNSITVARWRCFGSRALQLRAALLRASDRVSHLADRARRHRGVATRRETRGDPGVRLC